MSTITIVQAEHGVPSPRDLRVLHGLRHLPTLRTIARHAIKPQPENVTGPTLIVPQALSHPHYVRIRLPKSREDP